jgi:hypothetical protein
MWMEKAGGRMWMEVKEVAAVDHRLWPQVYSEELLLYLISPSESGSCLQASNRFPGQPFLSCLSLPDWLRGW